MIEHEHYLPLTPERVNAAAIPRISPPHDYNHAPIIAAPILTETALSPDAAIARFIESIPNLNPTNEVMSKGAIESDSEKDAVVRTRLEGALAAIKASILVQKAEDAELAEASYDAVQGILQSTEQKLALEKEKQDIAIAAIQAQFGKYALDLIALANGEQADHERAANSSSQHLSEAEAVAKTLIELISADMVVQPSLESERDAAITMLETLSARKVQLQEDLVVARENLKTGLADQLALEKAKQGIFRELPGLRDIRDKELHDFLNPFEIHIHENLNIEYGSEQMKTALEYVLKNHAIPESLEAAITAVKLGNDELLANEADYKVTTATISEVQRAIQIITDELQTIPDKEQEAASLLLAARQKLILSDGNSQTADNVAQIFSLINKGDIGAVIKNPVPAELLGMVNTKTTAKEYSKIVDKIKTSASLSELPVPVFKPSPELLAGFDHKGAESFEDTVGRVGVGVGLGKAISLIDFATGKDFVKKFYGLWNGPRERTKYEHGKNK